MFAPEPIEGTDRFWHPAFAEWIDQSWPRYATPDELYTIKVSHSYWEIKNGSWLKHIEDAAWLKSKGASLIPDLHRTLYGVWEERYGSKRVTLDMESGVFFTDAVKRKYDHDSLHASVAYGDQPMYLSVLKDGSAVAVSLAKIKALPFTDQVKLFREEVYATALERIVIPKNYRCSPRAAYAWALRRTITSLTKGWSAQFLVENYDTFRAPDTDYVARHLSQQDKLIPLEVGS